MSNKVPPLWKIFLLLISIPAGWLIVWFLLVLVMHLVGFSLPSVGDANGLLATIGSIMGAIFTVGGLIVALVAVLTQIQLQDRVKQEVDKAKQEVEDTFNNKLRIEYEKRIQDQVEGMLAFFQATSTTDWRQAEALVREALQKYPSLPGMRSYLGLLLSRKVQEYFSGLLVQNVLQNADSFASAMYLHQLRYAEAPPKVEAIDWLKEALEHQDNPEGQVSAALAFMYGFNEAYGKMLDIIQEVRINYPALLSYLQSPPDHLMMLIYACNKDQLLIQELMKALDVLPPTEEEVCTAIQKPPASTNEQFVDWYAVELNVGANTSKMPVKMRILSPHTQETVKVTRAIIFKHGQEPIPRPDYSREPDPSKRVIDLPVDELVKQLFDEFLFLCPT